MSFFSTQIKKISQHKYKVFFEKRIPNFALTPEAQKPPASFLVDNNKDKKEDMSLNINNLVEQLDNSDVSTLVADTSLNEQELARINTAKSKIKETFGFIKGKMPAINEGRSINNKNIDLMKNAKSKTDKCIDKLQSFLKEFSLYKGLITNYDSIVSRTEATLISLKSISQSLSSRIQEHEESLTVANIDPIAEIDDALGLKPQIHIEGIAIQQDSPVYKRLLNGLSNKGIVDIIVRASGSSSSKYMGRIDIIAIDSKGKGYNLSLRTISGKGISILEKGVENLIQVIDGDIKKNGKSEIIPSNKPPAIIIENIAISPNTAEYRQLENAFRDIEEVDSIKISKSSGGASRYFSGLSIVAYSKEGKRIGDISVRVIPNRPTTVDLGSSAYKLAKALMSKFKNEQ